MAVVQVQVQVQVHADNFHGPSDILDPNRCRNRNRDFETSLVRHLRQPSATLIDVPPVCVASRRLSWDWAIDWDLPVS